MTCTCHVPENFCTEHNRYTPSLTPASAMAARCSCLRPFDLDVVSVSCPQHGHKFAADPTVLHVTDADLQHIAGLRAQSMLATDVVIERIIHAEPVTLRPAGYDHAAEIFSAAPKARTRASTAPCSCDMPDLFGHDTGCELHPGPVLSDPLQLLVAATQLISDQPTTEQWQTIKKAIQALVPSPFRSE